MRNFIRSVVEFVLVLDSCSIQLNGPHWGPQLLTDLFVWTVCSQNVICFSVYLKYMSSNLILYSSVAMQTLRREGGEERPGGGEGRTSRLQWGLSPKQNKVNVDVTTKCFIKRSKVGGVTWMGLLHLWIVSLISWNTRFTSQQLLRSDATWHL